MYSLFKLNFIFIHIGISRDRYIKNYFKTYTKIT